MATEDFYQQLGKAAVVLARDCAGKILVYAEVEDGVISADVFYLNTAGNVRYRFGSESLQELIYSFWEQWQKEPGNAEWRTLAFVVDAGKFAADLTYPDQIDPDEDVSERRPLIIKKYFGDTRVDYSNPE